MANITPWKINKSTSYFIPYVDPDTSEEYIKDVFEVRSKIGKVKRVDVSRYLCNKTMRPKCRAFVHLECLYDTPFSVRFRNDVEKQNRTRNKLRHGGYGSTKFWTVLPYLNKEDRVHNQPRRQINPVNLSDVKSEGSDRTPSPVYLLAQDYDDNYRPPSPDYPPDEKYPKGYLVY